MWDQVEMRASTETNFLPLKYTIGTVFNAFVDYLFPARNLSCMYSHSENESHNRSHTRSMRHRANNNSHLISYYRNVQSKSNCYLGHVDCLGNDHSCETNKKFNKMYETFEQELYNIRYENGHDMNS